MKRYLAAASKKKAAALNANPRKKGGAPQVANGKVRRAKADDGLDNEWVRDREARIVELAAAAERRMPLFPRRAK